jgi:hypothetical protein
MSEIYHGETYDARLERSGWDAPGFDDSTWTPVTVADSPKDVLIAPEGPPVRRIEEIRPRAILKTPSGLTVLDMGQNMVGWLRLTVQGPAGTQVTLRHAEVLDSQGEFYVENLRGAKQTVTYTLKGGGPETYEPRFTFQGFRYVAVQGWPGELTLDAITGIVVHSGVAPAGEFTTSMPLVNQLQHNILWGEKGNFVDVPTDCPQRDERLGWTGDAQAFARTAAFNSDVAGFFRKWLKDLAADQLPTAACRTWCRTSSRGPIVVSGSCRVGRRRRHYSLDHVSGIRRSTVPRGSVPEHGEVGRLHARPRRRRRCVGWRSPLRRLAGVCDDAVRTIRGRRPARISSPPRFTRTPPTSWRVPRACSGRRTKRPSTSDSSRASRPRSIASSSRHRAASARPRRPRTCWRCSSISCRSRCGPARRDGSRSRSASANT